MFCQKCGTEIPDGSAFCSNCGQPVAGANVPNHGMVNNPYPNGQQGYAQNNVYQANQVNNVGSAVKKNQPVVIAIAVIAILVCAVVGVMAFKNKPKTYKEVQIDAYNVYTGIQTMVANANSDYSNINPKTISEEVGINLDDTDSKCEAYIDVLIVEKYNSYTGEYDDVQITDFVYYDKSSNICLELDVDNSEWNEVSTVLHNSNIEVW